MCGKRPTKLVDLIEVMRPENPLGHKYNLQYIGFIRRLSFPFLIRVIRGQNYSFRFRVFCVFRG